jgi:hypothetical protein
VSVHTLLDTLAHQGISVRVCEDGSLGVKPRNKLTDELLTILRQHKPDIIAALTSSTKEIYTATGTNLTRASEQQDLWQPRQIVEVCEKCGGQSCWLTPLGRWCLLTPVDQEEARARRLRKPHKTQPVSRPPSQPAPDETTAGYWTRLCNDTLDAWKRKDWGPCPYCGQNAWYQHMGFSLCGICTPQQDYSATVQC